MCGEFMKLLQAISILFFCISLSISQTGFIDGRDYHTSGGCAGSGTVGNTNVESGTGSIAMRGNKYTAGATFTLGNGHVYTEGSGLVTIAIYSDNSGVPDALLAQSSSESVVNGGWTDVTFTGGDAICIESGTTYWLMFFANAGIIYHYVAGGDDSWSNTTFTYPTLPDPETGGSSPSDRQLSLYITD